MTDEQIIKTLKNIKGNCGNGCGNCVFQNDMKKINTGYNCQIEELTEALYPRPDLWDIEELERIVKQ